MDGCIDGYDGSLKSEFLTASERTAVGELRAHWQAECGAPVTEFEAFARRLRLRLGSTNAAVDVGQHVADRMANLGLKDDETALLVAAGIVRQWIKDGTKRITRELLEGVLSAHHLRAVRPEHSVTVYIETIKKRRFDLEPDYLIDWREHFVGSEPERGHRIVDPVLWNKRLLPELQRLEGRINHEAAPRLIRARGFARLSAWFAFGHVLCRVAGYEIEVQQGASYWRTDAAPSGLTLTAPRTPEGAHDTSALVRGRIFDSASRACDGPQGLEDAAPVHASEAGDIARRTEFHSPLDQQVSGQRAGSRCGWAPARARIDSTLVKAIARAFR